MSRIVKLNADGTIDTSFNIGTGVGSLGLIRCMELKSNNQIIIAGIIPTYNNITTSNLVLLNPNGSIDSTFNVNSSLIPGAIYSMELQSDNKIIVYNVVKISGTTSSTATSYLKRFNANGSLDNTFSVNSTIFLSSTSSGFTLPSVRIIYDIKQLSNSKILISGDFNTVYGQIYGGIARLNSNGTVDTTFNVGTGISSGTTQIINGTYNIYSIDAQADNKIIIGGSFPSFNNTSRNCIARLNENGSLDTNFNPGTGVPFVNWDKVKNVKILADNKVLISGNFDSYNNVTMKSIARLNSDIVANDDNGTASFGTFSTPIQNVRLNDTYNGALATSTNTSLSLISSTTSGITLNTTTGSINVSSTVPTGIYYLTYQICASTNLSLCDTATVKITVCASQTLDLMIKDGLDDTGVEPNNTTQYMWNSSDIWVRNNQDNGLVHENPVYYSNGNSNYIYIKVTNRSCVDYTGNDQLKVYWAKASTGLSWPNPWEGGVSEPITNASMGQPIGSQIIPNILAGQEVIMQIPWEVPNPANYSEDQWHFCLLTRIESTNDPIDFPETWDLNSNVRNNNNIAWKNVTVVNPPLPNPLNNDNNTPGGVIAVANPFNEPHTFYLELVKEDLETGKPIYVESEVKIKMNQVLYDAWERGGKIAQNLDSTLDEKNKIIKGNNVILDNIAFNAKEIGTLNLTFNFLTEELTDKSKFVYHVIQKDSNTGNIIGGETYVINKDSRAIFLADAGGTKSIDKNVPITISATQINEPALYNWYDTEGNLIYQGKDLTISADIATKYRLEIIALSDGYKDYSDVEIVFKPSVLEEIFPNPASNNININYKLNDVSSAYIMIIGNYGANNESNNYILDVNSSNINIDISQYQNGLYTVALICDGQIIDAKTVIKE